MSDTFLGHSINILNGNVLKQAKIQHQLSDINNAPNAQLAKVQDDFLKFSEINRLLASAVEVSFRFLKLFSNCKLKIMNNMNLVPVELKLAIGTWNAVKLSLFLLPFHDRPLRYLTQ